MSQITYRANLSAKNFPLLAQNWGRTVIVAQYDNTFNRQLNSAAENQSGGDIGIPQVFYCHNVFPTAQGFQSVGFDSMISPPSGGAVFSNIFDISGISTEQLYLGIANVPQPYVLEFGSWVLKSITLDTSKKITVATTQGETFIYTSGQGCWRFNFITRNFEVVTLTGIVPQAVDGIFSSYGYMGLWTKQFDAISLTGNITNTSPIITNILPDTSQLLPGQEIQGVGIPANSIIFTVDSINQVTLDTPATATTPGLALIRPIVPSEVLYSSTIDPTDFVPSLVTGAGGGSVEQAKGPIVACVTHILGFFVFTTQNIVAAIYSNNIRFPFNYREITNSGGITDINKVTYDVNSGNIYAFTSSGLQLITSTQAQNVYSDVTDYLAGDTFEDFDETTNTFTTVPVNGRMRLGITIIGDRFFILSYGLNSFTHAIVFDLAQKRVGKLKISHVKIISDFSQISVPVNSPKKLMTFLLSTGELKRITFDAKSWNSRGLIIFGRYQFVRARLLVLHEIRVENLVDIYNPSTFATENVTEVIDLYTFNGKDYLIDTPILDTNTLGFRHYKLRREALNHSLAFKGPFDLTSLELVFSLGGSR